MATGDDFRKSCNNDDANEHRPKNFRLKNEESNEVRAELRLAAQQSVKTLGQFTVFSCVVCSPPTVNIAFLRRCQPLRLSLSLSNNGHT